MHPDADRLCAIAVLLENEADGVRVGCSYLNQKAVRIWDDTSAQALCLKLSNGARYLRELASHSIKTIKRNRMDAATAAEDINQ